MEIVSCSNCGVRVIPREDGLCPGCHRDLNDIGRDDTPPTVDALEADLPPRENQPRIPTHFDLFWILFSLRGRISLGMMWIATGLSFVCCIGVVLLIAAASSVFPLLQLAFLIIPIVAIWNAVAIGAKRFHDIGWPGWLIVPGLIPLFGQFFLFFTIGILKGNRGDNRYGYDPRRTWSSGMIDEQ